MSFAHTNKLFLVLIVLSILTYFERPDYNLPLFAFALLLWDYKDPQQKTRLWYLMAFSLITDMIWIIYWGSVWNSYNNSEKGICMFTLAVSILEFVIKIITVILLFVKEPECKSAVTHLPSNIKSIFKGPQNEYQTF